MQRFHVMERRWVAGAMQLVVMDWKQRMMVTFTEDEMNTQDFDGSLRQFILEHLDELKSDRWKNSDSL